MSIKLWKSWYLTAVSLLRVRIAARSEAPLVQHGAERWVI